MEPVLSRSQMCDTGLSEISRFAPELQNKVATLQVLKEGLLSVETTKIDRIIENRVVDETLLWLTEDDVAFSMGEIAVEDDKFADNDESDTNDSEDDIGWMVEGQWEG